MTYEASVKPKVTLVAFGGPSSSGKTTSAKALHSLLKNSSLIHLDDFYLPDDEIPIDPATKEQNWDCPEAIDFDRFFKHIRSIQNGDIVPEIKSIELDVDLHLTPAETESFIEKVEPLQNETIVMVDGFMLFHDRKILDLFDIKLFYHASFDTLKERRESRKGYNTVLGFWVDPPHYFENIVWPAYDQSHRYLFEKNDVNGVVNQQIQKELSFSEFKNETGTSLVSLVDWTLDRFTEYFN